MAMVAMVVVVARNGQADTGTNLGKIFESTRAQGTAAAAAAAIAGCSVWHLFCRLKHPTPAPCFLITARIQQEGADWVGAGADILFWVSPQKHGLIMRSFKRDRV